jgi:hypothetical protein
MSKTTPTAQNVVTTPTPITPSVEESLFDSVDSPFYRTYYYVLYIRSPYRTEPNHTALPCTESKTGIAIPSLPSVQRLRRLASMTAATRTTSGTIFTGKETREREIFTHILKTFTKSYGVSFNARSLRFGPNVVRNTQLLLNFFQPSGIVRFFMTNYGKCEKFWGTKTGAAFLDGRCLLSSPKYLRWTTDNR